MKSGVFNAYTDYRIDKTPSKLSLLGLPAMFAEWHEEDSSPQRASGPLLGNVVWSMTKPLSKESIGSWLGNFHQLKNVNNLQIHVDFLRLSENYPVCMCKLSEKKFLSFALSQQQNGRENSGPHFRRLPYRPAACQLQDCSHLHQVKI